LNLFLNNKYLFVWLILVRENRGSYRPSDFDGDGIMEFAGADDLVAFAGLADLLHPRQENATVESTIQIAAPAL
jgi:hypothetical protein